MEIQDRNGLLQNLLNLRDFGNAAPDLGGVEFVDVLKSQPDKDFIRESVADKFVLSKNDYIKSDSEQKMVNASKKKLNKTAEKNVDEEKKPVKKHEVDEEKAVSSENGQVEKVVSETKRKSEVNDVVSGVSKNVVTDENLAQEHVINPVNVTFATIGDEDASELLSDVDAEILLQDIASDEAATVEELSVSQEEFEKFEQAKLLDSKLGTDKKIKIEVDVKEEKIAAVPVKDILQNRFEFDEIVRNSEEASQSKSPDDVFAENLSEEILTPEVETDSHPQTKAFPEVSVPTKNDTVAFAEVKIAQESIKQVSSDTSVLSLSGKEAVWETANVSHREAFSRINETSVREPFKGLGKEAVEQIKVNITKSAVKGIDTIDIQLKPEDLGKVQVKMQISKDGKLQADIVVSRQETLDVLQKELSSLTKAFTDAGFDADNRSFNFSFQGENQAQKQKDDNGFSNFIGNTLEQEAELIAENNNFEYDPIRGLNIKV